MGARGLLVLVAQAGGSDEELLDIWEMVLQEETPPRCARPKQCKSCPLMLGKVLHTSAQYAVDRGLPMDRFVCHADDRPCAAASTLVPTRDTS